FVPIGQDAAVDLRVEGLDPPSQHLRRGRDRLHAAKGDAGGFQPPRRPSRGDQVETEPDQPLGEGDNAGLVIHGQQRPHGSSPSMNLRMVSGYNRRSTALMRSWRLSLVSNGSTTTASWARIGPVSTSAVATCTLQPVTLTPAARGSSTACQP